MKKSAKDLELELQTHFLREDVKQRNGEHMIYWESPDMSSQATYQFWKELWDCKLCREEAERWR